MFAEAAGLTLCLQAELNGLSGGRHIWEFPKIRGTLFGVL